MKTTIVALAASLALTNAMPARRQVLPAFSVTLNGATNDPADRYTVSPVLGGGPIKTNNVLGISTVTYDHNAAHCTFVGVDGTPAEGSVFVGPNTKQLGPPQTILTVTCSPNSSSPPPASLPMTLFGAAGAQYSLTVPVLTASSAPFAVPAAADPERLGVSRVEYDHSLVSHCAFTGVDGAVVEANGGQLGPPEKIVSILCY